MNFKGTFLSLSPAPVFISLSLPLAFSPTACLSFSLSPKQASHKMHSATLFLEIIMFERVCPNCVCGDRGPKRLYLQEGTFWDVGKVLYLGGGYTRTYTYKMLSSCIRFFTFC